MRVPINLREDQAARLDELAAAERVSRAEMVRRAVDLLLADRDAQLSDRRAAIDGAFGMWADRGVDAVQFLEGLRVEWDREWDPD